MSTPQKSHAASSEPIDARRKAALRSVDVQQKLHDEFAEKYGFLNENQEIDIVSAFNYLDGTFFRDIIDRGITVTNYLRTQVVTVALETGLNPFNNEIYGCITPFGDLKVMATMDGWMKIATSENITQRTYLYSDASEIVEINGVEYQVPAWIECTLVHKDKGTSTAREYFLEVFQNALHHLPSWTRPARMLRHVAFIQALRQMVSINALSDSDIISDITREYEALATKAQAEMYRNKEHDKPLKVDASFPSVKQTRALNIDLESIDIEGDTEVEAKAEPQVEAKAEPQVEAKAEPQVEAKAEPQVEAKAEPQVEAKAEPQVEVFEEVYVNRTVLQIIKPYLALADKGRLTIESLKKKRCIIKDAYALKWFDQQVQKLENS
ncbi:hypothetical protein [Vibrio sp. 1180_3]|uniref:hypothetical protein n=1 Tax=Vibrio sp. 1180_3 TaxID=2528832 RepID=UPI002404E074|nr:hypothetical protein [Vibrio sp. 1180_3]MDF9399154.1 hypothetical protein [Vibrio sp. 1180_3]